MPTKRQRRAHYKRPEITDSEWLYLTDRQDDRIEHFIQRLEEKKLWERGREQALGWWIARYPGTRPSLWWAYDAPRQEGRWSDLPEPRLRLGGTGTPTFEVLADKPAFHKGIPVYWMHGVYSKRYPGRGEMFDPSDPPMYESEFAYLSRHGLLTEGETGDLEPCPASLN